MRQHIIGFFAGFCLDLLIGDPHELPHPIRLIGRWIGWLDRRLMGGGRRPIIERLLGCLLVVLVCVPTVLIAYAVLHISSHFCPVVGIAIEAVLTAYLLAAKSLKTESMRVFDALSKSNIEEARRAVSMIVGRDTETLDEAGIVRAAVETVAENTTDGVIAPMLYAALGGPVLGFLYKAISTMDSMVGYRNERYRFFGTAAARLDDMLAFFPARIAALLMILSCGLLGSDFDANNAFRIFRRDRWAHKSPNAAQTESVVAGALHVRLAGNAYYFGKLQEKPFIGDDDRAIEVEDIRRVNHLMLAAAVLGEVLCVASMLLLAMKKMSLL
ncbi:MAG: cobalamin biosynthesis protein CobD [Lachnospiraceae bacterium]|nr:cobalamin biosynthesis protein CobD [Lachnospiraceae bacterium]